MTKAERERERSRHRNHARRARMTGAYCERVDRLVVLEADDGICGICGTDVDPLDFHVDHIVPIACGGAHAYWNVQVAHPACNVRKHVDFDGPVLPFVPLGSRKERAMTAALQVRDVLAEGLTYAQAADRLGVPMDQIRYRVRFLREKGVEVTVHPRGRRLDPARNGRRPMASRDCEQCGAAYTPAAAAQRFCSRPCSWKASGSGASYSRRDGRWVARVRVGRERVSLGRFATEAEALAAIDAYDAEAVAA